MKMGLLFIKTFLKEYRKALDETKLKSMKFKAAREFNRIYTYNTRLDSIYGNVWMCPTCNSIKKRVGISFLTGFQFEACCQFPEGHRLYLDAAAND